MGIVTQWSLGGGWGSREEEKREVPRVGVREVFLQVVGLEASTEMCQGILARQCRVGWSV